MDLFDGAHPPSLSTVTLIMAVCEGITWSRGVYGWYRSGAIAVYRSGNARVNTAFVQTAEALSGWRVKTGRDLGKGKEIGEDRMRKRKGAVRTTIQNVQSWGSFIKALCSSS